MILYEGPSMLDGKPIIAVATIGSRNEKTGDMIQTWIMRRDIAPTEALRTGDDASVCGDCPQRHMLGGGCYVVVHNAPLSVWRRFHRGGYDAQNDRKVAAALATLPLRMGSYGDPAALPFNVWEALLAQGPGTFTGYTHQWRTCDPLFRGILMASCDSEAEARLARRKGWRFFLVTSKPVEACGDVGPVVECLSDAQGLTCAECKICDGTRADTRSDRAASVAIRAHGSYLKGALRVIG